jgi:predicted small integral membrane protein
VECVAGPACRSLLPYDPSVRTKILGFAGVTVGLIIWAWALMVTTQIAWYGFWTIFNTLTGGD